MARDAKVSAKWVDGEHAFRLGWGQLIELQEAVDAGPFVILDRLNNHTCKVQDVSNVIRLGLVGGGMEPAKALGMVERYVQERPILESVPLAAAVLYAAVMGAPDEPLGEDQAETIEETD